MIRNLKLMFASSLLVGVFAMAPAVACPGKEKTAKAEEKAPAAPAGAVTTAMFRVDGMHCGGCGDNIKNALAKAGGVHKVEVSAADKRVTVTFDKDKISAEKIAKLISEAGYPATAEA
jgi:copper chaperone CopZ